MVSRAGRLPLLLLIIAASLPTAAVYAGPEELTDAQKLELQKQMAIAERDIYSRHYLRGELGLMASRMEQCYNLAESNMQERRVDKAVEALNAAIAAYSTKEEQRFFKTADMLNYKQSRNFVSRASCYMVAKSYQKVVDDCTTAIKFCPDYSGPYMLRAKAYDEMNNPRAARQDMIEAAKYKPIPGFLYVDFAKHKAIKSADKILATTSDYSRSTVEKKSKWKIWQRD
ncbi:MAG: hypothetical protein K2X93_26665 [Candidatus Obscuribacterales bacterium]|nr:hypothetical protein [Candidatus Obscuribacterales bacterium]